MLRTITLVTALLAYVVSAQAQGMKFGVHIDPQLSILGSNDNDVTAAGSNLGFSFGVEGEYYFQDGENYAITFGAGFAFNKGGKLQYEYAAKPFLDTEIDPSQFTNGSGDFPANGTTGLALTPNATVRYSANVVEIPVGLKLRTNELGDSYMRVFFHLPIATFGIPVAARGTIDASTASSDSITFTGTSSGENIISDINRIQISLGTGAGIEYSPNEEGGLRLIGGIYYHYNFIDMTQAIEMQGFQSTTFNAVNPTNGFHNIALRVGVIF